MNKPLEGKTALVTGSSRGVGRLIAKGLAELGCSTVFCHGRTEGACEGVALDVKNVGARAVIAAAELSKPDEVERLAIDTCPGDRYIDNNAAVMHPGAKAWRINNGILGMIVPGERLAPARLTAALLPPMIEKLGRIVNLTSIDKRRSSLATARRSMPSTSGPTILRQPSRERTSLRASSIRAG